MALKLKFLQSLMFARLIKNVLNLEELEGSGILEVSGRHIKAVRQEKNCSYQCKST